MVLGYQHFQIVVALTMIAGLVLLVIPVIRFTTITKVPVVSAFLVLLPIVNVAWLTVLATKSKPAQAGSRE